MLPHTVTSVYAVPKQSRIEYIGDLTGWNSRSLLFPCGQYLPGSRQPNALVTELI